MFHLHWKKTNPRIINATAIYITPVHSCQVCLLPSFVKIGIFEEFDSCVRRSNPNQIGFKSPIFRSVWPLNVMEDLENNRAPPLNYVKLFASFQSHRWIGSDEYAQFPPQPPGSLVSWGTVAKNVIGLYKTNTFYEQLHQIPWYRMKSTIFPHKFWRPFWISLVFRPKYVWFLVHIYVV